ncbi:extracellular solute-binding protein [Arthrobacter sp. H5]|uniref:sugar ABC transporter substrate-binding protein n=1 Tax=Arthrobacter sp. H5 TaxID=1267973 RepID=UPI0004B4BD82|nr:extracellular solute-binding protein [Arthrobacter sp. H5]
MTAVGAALAATLALSACGGAGGESAEEGGEDQTVTVWHYFSADNQVALMDEYAKKFEATNEGVTVENVYVPYDQMNSKVVSAAGAQTGPDVVVFNGAEWGVLSQAGALAPLDEQWSSFADADQFPDSVLHGTEEEMLAVQGYVNLLGLWYNADILKEIGVEPPTTIEELEAAMAAAKDAGHEGITLSALPQSQGEWQAYPWLTSQGFDYSDPNADDLAAGLAMANSWVEEGYLSKEATTWDQTVPFQQFTAGGVAFAENGNWQMGAAEADANFEYGVVPLPLGESGKVYLGGEGIGIGASADSPTLAWEYLTETYLDAEGQLLAVEKVGSIPAREDAAQDPAVVDNPLLAPFSATLAELGANYPDSVIPVESVADVQTSMGQAWSAAVGGQQSPEEAAAGIVEKLQSLIGQ